MASSKLTEKLVARVRDELEIELPADLDFRRLRPGHWQRSAGAWSWFACDSSGREVMGSADSITGLVQADEIGLVEMPEIGQLEPFNLMVVYARGKRPAPRGD